MGQVTDVPGPPPARPVGLQERLWSPFSDLGAVDGRRTVLVRGEGAEVEDRDGRRYIDATASLWYANIGYGRQEVVDAAAAQMGLLHAYSGFGALATPPSLDLAERIARIAPLEDPVVFFTSGGSDAVDSAVKIARRHWTLRGRPGKTVVVSRRAAYHGMHGFGTALGGITANSEGYGDLVPDGFAHVTAHDAGALADTIDRLGTGRVAAFFAEPVIGAGGVIPPPPGYLQAAREVCREREVLFVADEVITGFGRLGEWFASAHYDIDPDMLLMAKGLTSGYLPLGGVVASRAVWEPFAAGPDPITFRHGYTYSGHATACAAAIANLDVLEREDLLQRVRAMAPELQRRVAALADHPLVVETRHAGMLAAVQLDGGPALAGNVAAAAADHGVLTRAIGAGALQISPPFIITTDQVDRIVTALRHALDDVADAAG